MMEPSEEMLQQVGAFDPSDAKRVVASLEAQGIPFEVEADDSALFTPNRWLQLSVGMYPEGSKVIVFVPESKVPDAMKALKVLFPV
jgi:hypothetical protein